MKKIVVSLCALILSLTLISCNNSEDPIKVYTRDTSSGTRGAFFEILDLDILASSNEELAKGYVEVESNGNMMDSVKKDKNGIGYISLAGLANSGLKGLNFNGVKPTETNVSNGSYTLKRPFMYIRKAESDISSEIEKQLVNAFLAFMDSKDGKEIIKNNDGIVENLDAATTWDTIKGNHQEALNYDGNSVEIHFGGSTSVEKIAKALSAAFQTIAPKFKPMHAHSGSGAAFTGTRKDGALHIGFASRELKPNEIVDDQNGRLAWDAVVMVVNNDNELINITTTQAQKVFTGEYKNWNEIK